MKLKLLLLSAVLGVISVQAQDTDVTMITNRPGYTEASRAVFKTGFQIEAGLQYTSTPYFKDSPNATNGLLLPNLGLLYGVSENVEIRVFGNLEGTRDILFDSEYDWAFTGLTVGSKFNLLERDGAIPELAGLVTIGIPTGDFKSYPLNFVAAWSYSLDDHWGLSGNLIYGYEIDANEVQVIDHPNSLGYTVNVGYTFDNNLGAMIEFRGTENVGSNADFPFGVNGGFWYRITPKWQIDAIGGYGTNLGDYLVNVGTSLLIMK